VTSGRTLEGLYRDAVDIEFTVEAGRLYLLQVRAAKRTAVAALRIATEMVREGVLTQAQALARVSHEQLRKLLRPVFDPAALSQARILAQGLGSSPGQAHGAAVLDSDRAAERAAEGEAVILIRPVTSPQDIRGMLAAAGIVTAKGGALSHAAVVSRALDKPCIVGCNALDVDPGAARFMVEGESFGEGAAVSIDGTTGRLYAGSIPMQVSNGQVADVERLLGWADATSGAALWAASRSAVDIVESARTRPAGIGVIALTDLLIASGHIERFVVLLAAFGDGGPTTEPEAEITDLVRQSCAPAVAAAAGLPLHIRLPRVSSDRARRLVENWGELPPRLFLPLGSLAYVRAILRGIAGASEGSASGRITALIGGVTDTREIERFAKEVSACSGLDAGAMIQNVAALQSCSSRVMPDVELWIDVVEIVRTLYGFPTEVVEARGALRDYVAEGSIPLDPLVEFGPMLAQMVGALGKSAGSRIGIDGTGCPSEILKGFFHAGFRVFSVAFPRRDDLRLQLGQMAAEGTR
jgi:pyruvate,orthophosphate dikinase